MRRLQGVLLATAAVIGFVSVACAADMPVKAPPARVANWTGFYVGAGFGYGMYDLDTHLVAAATGAPTNVPLDQGGRGWFGTVQIGYDYQFAPNWVVGAFVDGDWGRIRGSHTGSSGSTIGLISGDMTLNRSWAAGGKLGYLVNPSLLSFVSAGFTQAHFSGTSYSVFPNIPTNLTVPSQNYNGYFIGGGAEYALSMAPGLFWKTEYRFADYGAQTLPALAAGAPLSTSERTHPYVQTVRTELVYRFGGGAPTMTANIPVKAPPARVANWTGFYVGVGGGYGMYDLDTQLVLAATGAPFNVPLDQGGRGWFGTAQIGYDYQFAANWLAGAFVDGDWARIRGSHTGEDLGIGLIAGNMTLNRSWAVGGKLGYLVNPTLASFVTAGFTQAHFSGATYAGFSGALTGLAAPAQNYNGYFIGGGAEYALSMVPGLFWKTEYRFADYGAQTLVVFATASGAPNGFSERTHPYVQTVRTELVWRFGAR